MKKPIITIERQYGSGGSVIGNLVAEKLGINCYNRQILKMTAERCGIAIKNIENAEENVPTSFLYSLLLSANPARTMEDNLPLSDKVFLTETDTGKVDVPKSITGGRCEITTDSGDITVEVSNQVLP